MELIQYLDSIKSCTDFDLLSDEFIENHINDKNIEKVDVNRLIEFMENNPYKNYGIPGRLVQILEESMSFNDYFKLIKSSIIKKPTYQILMMHWRILNSLDTDKKNTEKSFLNSIIIQCDEFEKNLVLEICNSNS